MGNLTIIVTSTPTEGLRGVRPSGFLIRQLYDGTCNPAPGRRALVIAGGCELTGASGGSVSRSPFNPRLLSFAFLRCSALPMFIPVGRDHGRSGLIWR